MPRTHGAAGQLRVRDVENMKAVLQRWLGIPWAELSAPARGLVVNIAELRVRLRLIERYRVQHCPDYLDADGRPPAFAALEVALLNSEQRAWSKLAALLPDSEADRSQRRMVEVIEAITSAREEANGDAHDD